jgi:aminopeptidase N
MIKFVYCFAILLTFLQTAFSQTPDLLKAEAQLSYNNGDFFTVIEKLDKVIKLVPGDGLSYYYRGLSKMFLGDQTGACSDLMVAKGFGVKPPSKEFFTLFCDSEKKYKFLKDFFYKNETLVPENGYRPLYTRKDSLRGSLRPERAYDVVHYNLELKLEPQKKFISGSNTIYFKPTQPIKKLQVDLFAQYAISSIRWNGTDLPFTREFDAIFVTFPEELKEGTLQNIVVNYSGKPQKAINPPWQGGFVWKKDKKGKRWDGVACEHLGASSWWPCKDHMSDEADSVKLTFIIPKDYDLISNGIFIERKDVDKDFAAHTWFIKNPINSYNVTFYMGKFSHFSDSITNNDGTYPLDYYVLPYNLDKAKETFKQTKEVMLVYEQLFGNYPFPEDGFGMIESPYEGMEHQGAIAYGNDYDKKSNPYIHKEYDYIIVHESAHEWWGNSLSATDMADMWIQEGFATYAELLFMEKRFSYEDYLKETVSKMFQIFNFWPLVENRGVNENTFASNDVYTKGAVLLHNLRCTMNDDSLFFKLIKDFAVKYKRKIVTSNDFVNMVNEYTGSDYTPFFDKFLKETSLPVLSYTWKKNGKNIELSFKWTEVKDGFVMPFGIRSGNNSFRIVGTTKEQKVVLNNAERFRFYNMWTGIEGAEKNSFTYYWTKEREGEQ